MFFATIGTLIYTIQNGTADALKYKMGVMYDIIGMYFLFRCLVREWEDVARAMLGFAIVSAPVALAFLVEYSTGRNMFSAFGGVPEINRH